MLAPAEQLRIEQLEDALRHKDHDLQQLETRLEHARNALKSMQELSDRTFKKTQAVLDEL